ncbi:MAG TPA: thiamine pyrophosphate-dependent enzyme [Bacteroidia bacterium]|jgi:2-oxoisovalerate dehydrogenase E1 component|nr:thiamine pyrophosphate-dependent enzyme [Bacteroidia bacterium]
MSSKEEISGISEKKEISFSEFKNIVLRDYRIAMESREASVLGRKEVLQGKAKFGIFGDGKEIAQVAMAKVFMPGDFRSGYYRDQTFMFAKGLLTVQEWFAGLYAHANLQAEPSSAGRQMGGHYSTHSINPDNTWANLTEQFNSSSDVSPTGSQMPRLLGLAMASKQYRNTPALQIPDFEKFSKNGSEIAFGTIGDASTSEGMFWEAINAAGVMQVPMLVSVWDDGYGISVPKDYQTTKNSISEALKGMQRDKNNLGYEILKVKGWDYSALCETYEKAASLCRKEHVPILLHIEECTQPQGHSTSGSHERYKTPERLQWEKDFDGIKKMREWILRFAIATEAELTQLEEQAKTDVKDAKNRAWKEYLDEIKKEQVIVIEFLQKVSVASAEHIAIAKAIDELKATKEPLRRDLVSAIKNVLRITRNEKTPERQELLDFSNEFLAKNREKYDSLLYTSDALNVPEQSPVYDAEETQVNGHEILRDNFDAILEKYPNVLVFGEDVGKLGDVNQGLENLQKKYGEERVFDTGIREVTIVGQAIGMAMRGLRPIAEIEYLDYLLYALQIMSDDLATLAYRTVGTQRAPVIVRTRGHRLEGIWHSGSPMGMVLNALRGMYVCVPRNMTHAAGMYNTLLASNEPALMIEPLNSYRLKEKRPTNMGNFKIPLGIPEIIREGKDVTIVTYGPLCRMSLEAAQQLEPYNISVEIIDVRTLLPFDLTHMIVNSIKKTNRVLFLDEDVPGGATAYMMQKALEEQGGYSYLDSPPKTLTSKEHRPAYGSDGDYFSKPSVDDIFDAVYSIMNEVDPATYPDIYS